MIRRERDSGQASAELVAVVPLILVISLAVAQLAIVGYALWNAGDAARAGARAAHVGDDVEAAVLTVLPGWLEGEARIEEESGVEVRVAAPALLPGLPAIRLSADASLGGPG